MNGRSQQLSIPIDQKFQGWEWRIQRLAWFAWALMVLIAFIGLLGPGPLSNRTSLSNDKAFAVSFERFLHYHNPTEIRIALLSGHELNNTVDVFIQQSLLDRMEVRRIEPEPVDSRLSTNGVTYSFRLENATRGDIVFRVDFEKYGRASGEVRIGDSKVDLAQFVYP